MEFDRIDRLLRIAIICMAGCTALLAIVALLLAWGEVRPGLTAANWLFFEHGR